MYLQVLAVPTPRGAGRGSLEQQQLSENYYTEHSEEHDEYEEAEVGALLGAGRRRARPPPHRDSLDSGLAGISAARGALRLGRPALGHWGQYAIHEAPAAFLPRDASPPTQRFRLLPHTD